MRNIIERSRRRFIRLCKSLDSLKEFLGYIRLKESAAGEYYDNMRMISNILAVPEQVIKMLRKKCRWMWI